MSDEPKRKAGSIRQYATLGKSKTLERPGTEAPERQDSQTLERPNAQEPERSSVETSRRLNVEAPERLSTQEPKRKRHTIYLTPALSKWLKVYAANTDQDMSNITEEALQRFREETDQ